MSNTLIWSPFLFKKMIYVYFNLRECSPAHCPTFPTTHTDFLYWFSGWDWQFSANLYYGSVLIRNWIEAANAHLYRRTHIVSRQGKLSPNNQSWIQTQNIKIKRSIFSTQTFSFLPSGKDFCSALFCSSLKCGLLPLWKNDQTRWPSFLLCRCHVQPY